jgi:hypothetical protein
MDLVLMRVLTMRRFEHSGAEEEKALKVAAERLSSPFGRPSSRRRRGLGLTVEDAAELAREIRGKGEEGESGRRGGEVRRLRPNIQRKLKEVRRRAAVDGFQSVKGDRALDEWRGTCARLLGDTVC